MAALQEPCFQGAHLQHVLMLTLPQIILYVIGLPIAGTIHLMRNKHRLQNRHFYTRYGLLYLGYRNDSAWWELVVAFRKVAIVSVGTFGTLLGVVDLQAHLALLVVFCSIAAHFIGRPFDMKRSNTRLLHNLELSALSICWLTFWGGLLFFLGHEKENTISDAVKVLTTVCLVGGNCVFLIWSMVLFVKEYLNDRKKKERRRTTAKRLLASTNSLHAFNLGTLVVPVTGGNDDNDVNDDNDDADAVADYDDKTHLLHAELHREEETKKKTQELHDEFEGHELALNAKTKKRQKRHTDNVQLRLLARLKVRQSKAMSKSTNV
jgi:hypothetical protein